MIGRRLFLISGGCLVAGSALPKTNGSAPAIASRPSLVKAGETRTDQTPAIALHIDGWESSVDSEQSTAGQIWIDVNRSWRTAWR